MAMKSSRKVVGSFRTPEGRYKEDATFSPENQRFVSKVETSGIFVSVEHQRVETEEDGKPLTTINTIEEKKLFFRTWEKIYLIENFSEEEVSPPSPVTNSTQKASSIDSDSDSDSSSPSQPRTLRSAESISNANHSSTSHKSGVFIEDSTNLDPNIPTPSPSNPRKKKSGKQSLPKQKLNEEKKQEKQEKQDKQEKQKYEKILIGYRTGEVWLGNITKHTISCFNSDKCINSTSVVCVDWISYLSELGGFSFFVIHADGTLYFYDERRGTNCENFPPPSPSVSSTQLTSNNTTTTTTTTTTIGNNNNINNNVSSSSSSSIPSSSIQNSSSSSSSNLYQKGEKGNLQVNGKSSLLSKSQKKRNENVFIVDKQIHLNPCSRWLIGRNGVSGAAFSPQNRHIFATIDREGVLRVLDHKHEKILVSFKSYFGGLTCLCWSPDGKYILTGGEDDIVTIYNWQQETVIARCVGHESWITSIKFDSVLTGNDVYRFISVAQDTQMIFWDFSIENIVPPKRHSKYEIKNSRNSSNGGSDEVIPAPRRDEIATIQPISTVVAHNYPIFDLVVTNDCIITCSNFDVKIWKRPSKVLS